MARVAILLGLFNGAAHLRAQLDSYDAQSLRDWSLLVSDDGGADGGAAILADFALTHDCRIITGPRQGFAQNFLHLIAETGPEAELAALSDQDDVWLADKLGRAEAALAGQKGPALYCGRTIVVGPDLQRRGASPDWRGPFGFANALVQNVASGNTIVLNRAALDLAQTAIGRIRAAEARDIVAHDWFLYQLVSGAGGTVIFDRTPVLLYRQHDGNSIGANRGWRASVRRFGMVLSGDFRDWNRRNIAALSAAGDVLRPDSRAALQDFAALRQAGLLGRLVGLWRLGLYRKTLPGTVALWVSALIARV